jgi:hypothetical protein
MADSLALLAKPEKEGVLCRYTSICAWNAENLLNYWCWETRKHRGARIAVVIDCKSCFPRILAPQDP